MTGIFTASQQGHYFIFFFDGSSEIRKMDEGEIFEVDETVKSINFLGS